jgi:glycylpeptide N-tetradecanoyltransferase
MFTILSGEGPPIDDGYIEPSKPRDQVRQEPYPLPKDFEWTTLDIEDPKQVSHIIILQRFHQTYSFYRIKKSMISCHSTTWKMTMLDSVFNIVLSFLHGKLPHLHFFGGIMMSCSLRALKPPGYHKEWHIGVRVSSNKKLVAFISGVPMSLRVRQK